MTKFLNISTDNTLGGNAPSDELVVSQKAIKEYVDNQAGGGGYHPDLFTWQWADHELNDVQWLRADTFSWQSGAVYQAAYQHLADEIPAGVPTITLQDSNVYVRYTDGDVPGANHPYCWKSGTYTAYTNSETPSVGDWTYGNQTTYLENYQITATGTDAPSETETIAGITISYYVAADGHKIVLADQESNVAAIYAATGVAWYYIVDTTNQRFKLPRSSHNKYTTELGVIGTGKTLGLTDGTNNYGLCNGSTYARVTVGTGYYGSSVSPYGGENAGTGADRTLGVTTDSTKSGVKTTTIAQDTNQYKYLYFYVGQFTQTALENTAGLNTELFNGKVDTGHQVIAFQAPTAANNYTWYRKYADGWVEQGGRIANNSTSTTVTLPIVMANMKYTLVGGLLNGTASTSYEHMNFNNLTSTGFIFTTYDNYGINWQVSGMAA